MAAMKKAVMLLIDVRAMLLPVRRRQFPIRSFQIKHRYHSERGEDEPRSPPDEMTGRLKTHLQGAVTSRLSEGVSQQEHVVHADPQCQKG